MDEILKELEEAQAEAAAATVRTQFAINRADFEKFRTAVLKHYQEAEVTVQVNKTLMVNGGKHPVLGVARCPLALTRVQGEGAGGSLQVWLDRTQPRKMLNIAADGGLVLPKEVLDGFGVPYSRLRVS